MPAWSEPGSHSVGRPRTRDARLTSCRVTNMARPISAPVTLGGHGDAERLADRVRIGHEAAPFLPPLVQTLLRVAVLEVLGKARVVRPGHDDVVVHARARGGSAAPHERTAVGGTDAGADARVNRGVRARREAPGARIARAARAVRVASGGAQREHVADAGEAG